MATLPTNRVSGDVIASADIDAIATQVNANTDAIATNTTDIAGNLVAANNLSDVASATTAVANLGLADAIVAMPSGANCRIWVQSGDPLVTNPGVPNDGDLWASPLAS